MKRTMTMAAILAASMASALAQGGGGAGGPAPRASVGAQAPVDEAQAGKLTVEEAIGVVQALAQLSAYQTGVDKDGKPTTSPYRFGADVLYAMAINIDLGRRVEGRFNSAGNALIMQNSDGTGTVPEDKLAQHKLAVQKMLDAPSNVGYVRLKLEDLCLSVTPKCKDAGVAAPNPIPAPVLAKIIPILDR